MKQTNLHIWKVIFFILFKHSESNQPLYHSSARLPVNTSDHMTCCPSRWGQRSPLIASEDTWELTCQQAPLTPPPRESWQSLFHFLLSITRSKCGRNSHHGKTHRRCLTSVYWFNVPWTNYSQCTNVRKQKKSFQSWQAAVSTASGGGTDYYSHNFQSRID